LDSPCVGAPILDRQGETIGAICCYGNAHAATEGNIRTVSLFCDLLHPQIASMSESAGDMADAVPGGRMEEYRRKLSEADTKLDALRLACLNAAFSADPSAGLAGDERAARLSRVARYARIFAEEFGVKPGKADLLSEAVASAILDAGKPQEHTIETPDLFAETDPDLAKRDEPVREPLRRSADIELRRIARLIAEGRHERWDGAGGPQGLKGDSIPVDARVVALAETLEMLTGKFPGRDGEMPVGEALETIRFGAGRHFSLEEVRAVEALESEIRAICES
jgi:response regulator RpfG family c-di-GMP phosphodiesterase